MILSNSLEQWIAKKWDARDARNRAEGIAIGIEEGEKKGMEIGLEEGRANALAEFRAWNDRRLEAESRGEAFDEPMPGGDNGSVHTEED